MKQKKNVDYWLSLNCDPRLCSLSRTRCGWLFCIFCFSFFVVPNCIVFSSIESIDNINKLPVQMLRKTTPMSAATVNKFVNKADVGKEWACWKARAWNDSHQKQWNKFLTSLTGSEAKSFAKFHGRYQQTFFVHSGIAPFSKAPRFVAHERLWISPSMEVSPFTDHWFHVILVCRSHGQFHNCCSQLPPLLRSSTWSLDHRNDDEGLA